MTERYITRKRKLRISGYPSQVGWWKLPKEDGASVQMKGFSGPVGTGKTTAVCLEALRLAARNPGCFGIVGAPTFPMLEDVTWAEMLRLLDGMKIRHFARPGRHKIVLPAYRHEILFRSLSNPERLRGPNAAWCMVDELSLCTEDAWNILEGRIRDPRAQELCMGGCWTPKGFNWLYHKFVGSKKLPGHQMIMAQPKENKAVLARQPDYYERLARSYDEKFFAQEGLGKYLPVFSGMVYRSWDPDLNGLESLEWDPQEPILWALDFNVDPMTSVLAQERRIVTGWADEMDKLHVLDEIVLRDSGTEQMCEEFHRRTHQWRMASRQQMPVRVYGDPAGNQRRSSASQTDWDIVRSFFSRHSGEYLASYHVESAAPAVKDRVNTMNGLLHNSLNERRLYVDPRCKELRSDFEACEWATDSNKNVTGDISKKDPKRTHVADALGYLCHREYGPKTATFSYGSNVLM